MLFKGIYYWMYRFAKRFKTNDDPAFNAYLLVVLLEGLNLITIFGIISDNYLNKKSNNASIIIGFSIFIVVTLLNYFFIYSNRKIIVTKFSSLSPKTKTFQKVLFIGYFLFTLLLFYYSKPGNLPF